ncbi:hypothetical protein C2S52_001963 [Perilla frutescens var. hirtella]|nr:hypothetical protein C2S52_001963 [Perilla frutescens var. hirtella]
MESALSLSTARMLAWRPFQLHGHSRFGLLSIYPQFRRNINYYLPKFPLKSHGRHNLEVSASISAKPSSKLRKKPQNPEPDDKLAALRELFIRPDVNIPARSSLAAAFQWRSRLGIGVWLLLSAS